MHGFQGARYQPAPRMCYGPCMSDDSRSWRSHDEPKSIRRALTDDEYREMLALQNRHAGYLTPEDFERLRSFVFRLSADRFGLTEEEADHYTFLSGLVISGAEADGFIDDARRLRDLNDLYQTENFDGGAGVIDTARDVLRDILGRN